MVDVVVLGGGPGGSAAAITLAQRGLRVRLLEKGRHPRFHLGESLLPQTMPLLESLGVLEAVRSSSQIKHGACFHDRKGEATALFDFGGSFSHGRDFSFQVTRDTFDELLFRRAASLGVDAREEWEGTSVRRDGDRMKVDVRGPAGETETLEARFVVDATGRDALTARSQRGTAKVDGLDQTALFSHFHGVRHGEGRRAGDIQIPIFGGGWFWVIPFKGGTTSVGAVCTKSWIAANRDAGITTPTELFDAAVRETPAASRVLAGATRAWDVRATADFSYRVSDLTGDGWISVGDAGGFIDPLFSTGVHLAIHGAIRGGHTIADAFASGDLSRGSFEAWATTHRRGAELFIGVVQAFYRGELETYLFSETKHPFLRKAITSLLSGDVFDADERWAGELRRRFPAA